MKETKIKSKTEKWNLGETEIIQGQKKTPKMTPNPVLINILREHQEGVAIVNQEQDSIKIS